MFMISCLGITNLLPQKQNQKQWLKYRIYGFAKISKTLPRNSQAQDVRISVNSKSQYTKHIQETQKSKQNKSTPSEWSCTQKSVCFSSCISYICLESCLSKSCTQQLRQQPLLCPAQKVFFQPSTSKANIDVMIYLAIYPINAFTEGRGNSTSSKWNQLKNMNFTNQRRTVCASQR